MDAPARRENQEHFRLLITTTMRIEVLTLFPEMFDGVLGSSMIKRASDRGLVSVNVRNIRDYTTDKHHVADDAPYGGGPGMVMKAEPIAAAIEAVAAESPDAATLKVYLCPDGEPWTQALAHEFAGLDNLLLLCGHYEGVDERVRQTLIDREVSIGYFVLTGGEIPALVVIDSLVRLIPGVLGNDESSRQDSFGPHGLLDCPHYTRPDVFRGIATPEILLSGHHRKIDEWRRLQSIERTFRRRPDVIEKCRHLLTNNEIRFLESLANPPPSGQQD